MKYLSLFSGIGGFELGITQAYEEILRSLGTESTDKESKQTEPQIQFGGIGATLEEGHSVLSWDGRSRPICIGFSEIDKYASKIYQHHFPEHKNYGDITKINTDELPAFDLLVGGFPCQAFSIAGKRRGFADTRGTLFFEIARILRAKRPRLFLLENVKGLLSHDNGRTFSTIISTLDELGYDLQWQVLNSKNFGVPQNRERVFVVGHLRGTARPKVFPIEGQGNKNTPLGKSAETAVARTLTGGGHTGGNHSGMTILQVNDPIHSNDRVYDPEGLSPTLNTMQGGLRQPFIQNPKMQNYKKDYENSVAITATSYKEPPVVSGIRRLTPTECERLQGFPDGWTEGVSDTQRYKTLGNAITTNVVKEIMKRIYASL